MSKMKYDIEIGGEHFQAPTVKALLQRFCSRLTQLLESDWYPIALQYKGYTGFAYRTPDGWFYTIGEGEGEVLKAERQHSNGPFNTRDEAANRMMVQLAIRAWTKDTPVDYIPPFLIKNTILTDDYLGMVRFYHNYHKLKDVGLSNVLAHKFNMQFGWTQTDFDELTAEQRDVVRSIHPDLFYI